MKMLIEDLYYAQRRLTAALLIVTVGICGLAMGLALFGLRQPAERYAQVSAELALLFAYVFGLFALTSLVAAGVRRLAGDSFQQEVTLAKA